MLKFSTCLRNKILGQAPSLSSTVTMSAATIAAVDGGAGEDTLTDSGNGFVTAGFKAGDGILMSGWTAPAAANNKVVIATAVVAGTINVATGILVAKGTGDTVVMTLVQGGSIRDIFRNGILRVYSGTQPATADAAVTGSLLLEITLASGAFVSGAKANGINLGIPALGIIAKDSGIWSGVIAVTGTAGWYRFFANGADSGGIDTTYIYPRIDGAVGISGAELNFSSTSLVQGATLTFDSYQLSMAASQS